jgi:hypothetical protein
MADQLFDDYGIGTGSQNLFGGGMSKQELDQLLGLYPLPRTEVRSGQVVPTAEAVSRVNVTERGALDVANPPVDDFKPVQLFAPSTMDLSAFMASDLGDNQMTTQDPREYFTSGQPQSVVAGMFPEVEAMQRALYQQKQNEAMQAQAMQFASLSPMARAQYSLYMGGQQLGGAIGSALGGKDPQLQMIGLQSRILSELDPSNPNQQLQVAQKYAQVAPDLAMKIADNARSSLVKIAQANKERQASVAPDVQKAERAASITQAISQYKALPQTPEIAQVIQTLQAQLDFLKPKAEATPNEIQLAQAFAGEKGVKGTPEYNAEYVSQLLRLTDQKENIIDVGVADKTRKVVYFDKKSDQQFTMEPDSTGKLIRTPYSGGIDKTTAKVSATSTSKGADEGAKTIAELSAKRVDAAQVSATKAGEQAGLLQELLKTPQPISGSGAPVRVGALRVFSTFGLTSSKDDEALGNADKFTALAGERVISFIKALGSNPTDTDREFARTIGPALEKGTKTNADLINFLLERARKVVKDADAIENYFYDNNYSLRGYKSPFLTDLEMPKSKGSDKPVSQMTKQELLDEQTRLQQNK